MSYTPIGSFNTFCVILKVILHVVRDMCNMLCSPIHGAIEVPEIRTLQTLFFTLAVYEWGAILCMSISYIYCLEGAPL